MVLKKQTVWLVTMVSLIVVLGVYYMTAPPAVEQASQEEEVPGTELTDEEWVEWLEDGQVDILIDEQEPGEEVPSAEEETPGKEEGEEGGEEEGEAGGEEAEEGQEQEEEEAPAQMQETEAEEASTIAAPAAAEGMFSALRLEREETRSRLREDYTNTIASEDMSAAEKNDAHEKKENLQKTAQQESMLETLIQSQGYEDALVITEEDQVKIIVQAEKLTEQEVVEINKLAAEHLGKKDIAVGYHVAP
ncbi:SpoIIIAH-like family protein [Thalassorhabdus alkalitolerans]|uniref:SpoIIIAH-like family protein n=1 Tax=Thalassorhabdus alkalitolerans TaxID=2282697 RepID=A0ABW0YLQ6_9BACI